MGSDKVDTHFGELHGEGGIHHAIPCRLHWGAHSIDETHEISSTVFVALVVAYSQTDWTTFQLTFQAWMLSAGASTAAWAKRSDFTGAARRAIGPL